MISIESLDGFKFLENQFTTLLRQFFDYELFFIDMKNDRYIFNQRKVVILSFLPESICVFNVERMK